MFPIIVFPSDSMACQSSLITADTFLVFHWNVVGIHLRSLSVLLILECAFHNRLFRSCFVAMAKQVSGTFFSEMEN